MAELECGGCAQPFSCAARRPRVLPGCGHTFCETCIAGWLRDDASRVQCPNDGETVLATAAQFALSDFPENVFVTNLIERKAESAEQSPFGLCAAHRARAELVCVTDGSLLCVDCVLFGPHKTHEYEREEAFERRVRAQLANAQTQRTALIRSLRELLDERFPNVQTCARKRQQSLLREATRAFDAVRAALAAKEKAITEQIRQGCAALGGGVCAAEQRARRLLEAQTALGNRLTQFGDCEGFAELTRPAILEAFIGRRIERELEESHAELAELEAAADTFLRREVDGLRITANIDETLKAIESSVKLIVGAEPPMTPRHRSSHSDANYVRPRPSHGANAYPAILSQESLSDSEAALTRNLLNTCDDLSTANARPPPTRRKSHLGPQLSYSGRQATEPRGLQPELFLSTQSPASPLIGAYPACASDSAKAKHTTSTLMARLIRQEPPSQRNSEICVPPETPKQGSFLKSHVSELFAESSYEGAGITDNKLGAVIAEATRNRTLRTLVLDRNLIGTPGLAELLRRLANHPTLEKISLADNLLDEGAFNVLAENAKSLRKLRSFNLRGNANFRSALRARREAAALRQKGLSIEL